MNIANANYGYLTKLMIEIAIEITKEVYQVKCLRDLVLTLEDLIDLKGKKSRFPLYRNQDMERPIALILTLAAENLKRFTQEQFLKEEDTERIYLETNSDGNRYLQETKPPNQRIYKRQDPPSRRPNQSVAVKFVVIPNSYRTS